MNRNKKNLPENNLAGFLKEKINLIDITKKYLSYKASRTRSNRVFTSAANSLTPSFSTSVNTAEGSIKATVTEPPSSSRTKTLHGNNNPISVLL